MKRQTLKHQRQQHAAALTDGSTLFITIRNTFGPLLAICLCPIVAFLLCGCVRDEAIAGNISRIWEQLQEKGVLPFVFQYTFDNPSYLSGTVESWTFFGAFILLQILFMLSLPGKSANGPTTPNGNTPIYTLNGFKSFILTIVVYELLSLPSIGIMQGGMLFTKMMPLLGVTTISSLGLCCILYFKGLYFPTYKEDSGSSGNLLFDFYWGTELYPKVGHLNLKLLIHSRIGMTLWALLNISYLHAQFEREGVITNAIILNTFFQLLYIGKHHWWEDGYIATTDIIHDYEGFYLVYGCIVFMPFTFTLSGISLVYQPQLQFSLLYVLILCFFCFLFIYLNFAADDQKLRVRQSEGRCSVWGRKPILIIAELSPSSTHNHGGNNKNNDNDDADVDARSTRKNRSILLASGCWGISRHFHYFADIGGVFFWTLPAGLPWENPLVYFYWLFLTILFIDRANRDDVRCRRKYGEYWHRYCSLVPYKIFPYIW